MVEPLPKSGTQSQMKTLLFTLALLLTGIRLQAQTGYYVASHAASLSSSADTLTVQAPPAPMRGKAVQMRTALVSCSVPCTITLSQNGTPATTTVLAVTPLNLSSGSTSVAFSASNVGAGTTVRAYTLTSANDYAIDLSQFSLGPNGNLSLATNSITGTTNLSIFFTETSN